ncbi:MAG: 50S ribosomal protein L27 [Candidatus Omnitrophota bacterium]
MGGRVGGLSHIMYAETCGVKVSGGQRVKAGTVLTRQGDKWKPGVNVIGRMHLTALVAGTVYFTKKRIRKTGKVDTYLNIRPEAAGASASPLTTGASRKAKINAAVAHKVRKPSYVAKKSRP